MAAIYQAAGEEAARVVKKQRICEAKVEVALDAMIDAVSRGRDAMLAAAAAGGDTDAITAGVRVCRVSYNVSCIHVVLCLSTHHHALLLICRCHAT